MATKQTRKNDRRIDYVGLDGQRRARNQEVLDGDVFWAGRQGLWPDDCELGDGRLTGGFVGRGQGARRGGRLVIV